MEQHFRLKTSVSVCMSNTEEEEEYSTLLHNYLCVKSGGSGAQEKHWDSLTDK